MREHRLEKAADGGQPARCKRRRAPVIAAIAVSALLLTFFVAYHPRGLGHIVGESGSSTVLALLMAGPVLVASLIVGCLTWPLFGRQGWRGAGLSLLGTAASLFGGAFAAGFGVGVFVVLHDASRGLQSAIDTPAWAQPFIMAAIACGILLETAHKAPEFTAAVFACGAGVHFMARATNYTKA
ncbi:MAG: hypothetical protein MRY74_08965 [Neomegalonema sp.]|nr:hypothetical protein [Neomegalonema sp.]